MRWAFFAERGGYEVEIGHRTGSRFQGPLNEVAARFVDACANILRAQTCAEGLDFDVQGPLRDERAPRLKAKLVAWAARELKQ